MADQPTLLYLEPDDEITSVVRRLREAEPGRVVLVASGRSKATTSAVALRLLAGVAAEENREVALVADAAGRALAAEAGIPAFASVADASAEDGVPAAPSPARRAPIRVVRGEAARVAAGAPVVAPPPRPSPGSLEETMAVPVAHPAPSRRPAPRRATRPPARRGVPLGFVAILVAVLVLTLGALAAVAPAATIEITPRRVPVGPVEYTLALPIADTETGELQAEVERRATGVFSDPTPAAGQVTFSNYNTSPVRVDAGTQVAAGEAVFQTLETVVVPTGFFTIPGTAQAPVVALVPGPDGNLPADAIDTVLDEAVRNALRAFSDNPNRIVRNEEATIGGEENEEPEVTRQDVIRARRAIREDLERQLRDALEESPELVYGRTDAGEASIPVPDDLVGRRGEETFTLSGSLTYQRAHVRLDEVEAAAAEELLADEAAVPAGREVAVDTVGVEVIGASVEGDEVLVTVRVTAEADPMLDEAAIRDRIAGRTPAEAEAALQAIGEVEVVLWPSWVDRVPQLGWRIELRIAEGPRPSGSAPAGSDGS
jgi:hypothetical protein